MIVHGSKPYTPHEHLRNEQTALYWDVHRTKFADFGSQPMTNLKVILRHRMHTALIQTSRHREGLRQHHTSLAARPCFRIAHSSQKPGPVRGGMRRWASRTKSVTLWIVDYAWLLTSTEYGLLMLMILIAGVNYSYSFGGCNSKQAIKETIDISILTMNFDINRTIDHNASSTILNQFNKNGFLS